VADVERAVRVRQRRRDEESARAHRRILANGCAPSAC
jgi:hypothetical protein